MPLLAMVSRLTEQKGVDLVIESRRAVRRRRRCSSWCSAPATAPSSRRSPRSPATQPSRVAVTIGFDEAYAHLIEGRRRHLPDAVALRALRHEPDVQPALRHRRRSCTRPADCWTRWWTARRKRSPTGARPGSSSTRRRCPRFAAAVQRALNAYADRRIWRAAAAATAWRATSAGRRARGGTWRSTRRWPGADGRLAAASAALAPHTQIINPTRTAASASRGTDRRGCGNRAGRTGPAAVRARSDARRDPSACRRA